ncbi:hypothetical protein POVCU2_0007010 [Plasmodium ovale curtisi]|nr:hypothetical protein POVCU2_0007010 [Plasmodium ovale curtisi]
MANNLHGDIKSLDLGPGIPRGGMNCDRVFQELQVPELVRATAHFGGPAPADIEKERGGSGVRNEMGENYVYTIRESASQVR